MEIQSVIRIFACVSFVMGAVECFAGFKILRAMVIIWSFFAGAMLGVMAGVASDMLWLGVVLVVVFGILLAFLAYKFRMAGIFALVAMLSALALYSVTESKLPALIAGLVAGGLSLLFIKPVVLLSTAISGAGVLLASAYEMMELDINMRPVVTAVLWITIAIAGIAVQYITTLRINVDKHGSRIYSKPSRSHRSYTERRYPGMQRAYRNFCIKCGFELTRSSDECPKCGYTYDD